MLVSRPEIAPLKEAARSSHELQLLGINNQLLVINGLLLQLDEMCIRDSGFSIIITNAARKRG